VYITYENGAKIRTSFVSNLFGDAKIIGEPELYKRFKELEERNKVNLPKYEYPDNIITVSKIAYCVEKGVPITINKIDLKHYSAMDAQKKHSKTIFGSGFLASNKAAKALAEAKAEAAKRATIVKENNVIFWELSQRELQIIEELGD
jgi:hypothetical protein